MPGGATVGEAQGAPIISANADFGVLVVGYASLGTGTLTPWITDTVYAAGASVTSNGNVYSTVAGGTAGATAPSGTSSPSDGAVTWVYQFSQLTPAYGSAAALKAALGNGDGVDLAAQGIVPTPGNPQPTPISMFITPARTLGSYPIAANVAGIVGTAVWSNGPAPSGTFQPWIQIVTPGVVGTAGATAYASLGGPNGTRQLVSLGASGSYLFPASDGWGTGGQAGFYFGSTVTGSVSVASGVFGGGGSVDTETLILTVNGNGPHTLTLAVAGNAASEAAFAAAVLAQWPGLVVTLNGSNLVFTSTQGTIVIGAGTANANLGLTAATYAGTLLAGDVASTTTLPPMWGDSDIYAAGPPVAGMFAAFGASSQQFAMIWIADPVAAGDFPTLTGGLNYLRTLGKQPKLTVRFRDPLLTGSGETDAAYVTAFQTWRNACLDNRIECVAAPCLVTLAYEGWTIFRSGIAPYLARAQSFIVKPGQQGERIAQNPGWVGAGPLENASLRDVNGNPVGHDELMLNGIESNAGPIGGGICFCYRPQAAVAGTYITNRVTVLYGVNSEILTPMDRWLANQIEVLCVGTALDAIGGADIFDPVTNILDPAIASGLASAIMQAIRDQYGKEFQNPTDTNLVVINGPVTVNGANVGITGTVNVLFYGYTDTVTLTFVATR